MLLKLIPFVFVLLWASGFVGAKIGLQYAEPATLLSIRMVCNVILFYFLVLAFKRKVPTGMSFVHAFVVGLLIHGFYLGGVFTAIRFGMPAGLSSLIVGFQPILTALVLIGVAKERFSLSQWIGLVLGFAAIALVLMGKTQWQTEEFKWAAISLCIASLLGITVGTLYQKRYCQGADLLSSALVQYFAAGVMLAPIAFATETMQVIWTWEFLAVLGWLVVVLSCFAILLLLYMVEKGASSKVASVFYLVPPTTAIQAWLVFDETIDLLAFVGFLLAAYSVYLVVKAPKWSAFSKSNSRVKTLS
ncbi:DMT family transporter [Vibrio sonorensis]|uniref:DMT family transporter n=1 Tax=Vibrio sonorensis TaxID=1004316 RepID=UPI0008DAE0DB|nr:DMT family transporter [Vibrio sonorensis]